MKTIKFYTLGCKVNQYDTQSIRESFIQAGLKELEDSQPADIYLINTCTVTHRADAESLNLIRRAKRENPKAKIIVTGCLTELDSGKIKKQGGVSLIIKNKDKENIVEHLYGQTSQTNKGISFFKGHTRAFLKIQDGCNNFCSYCKVPKVRGPSISKPLNQIIYEATRLVKNGFKEIVLSGICLGAYGQDLRQKISLLGVVEALESLEGILRIRFSSIEAADISDELITKMLESKKLCPHLHIPLQSGDDEILKKMNRRYSCADYVNLIHKIRKKVPQIAITTDCLVGFPGESKANFFNTVKLIKQILPLRVHIFPFSQRECTPAFNFKDKISPAVIRQRINFLKNIAQACSIRYCKQFLNRDMEVLIEKKFKKDTNYWEGYTGNYIKVLIKSNLNLNNKLIPARLIPIGRLLI